VDATSVDGVVSALTPDALSAALRTWESAAAAAAATATSAATDALRFRVAALRGGHHSFTSRALAASLGSSVLEMRPRWRVDLEQPDVLLIALLVQVRRRARFSRSARARRSAAVTAGTLYTGRARAGAAAAAVRREAVRRFTL
jgi:adenylyl- and sulfurtransferase ThiI